MKRILIPLLFATACSYNPTEPEPTTAPVLSLKADTVHTITGRLYLFRVSVTCEGKPAAGVGVSFSSTVLGSGSAGTTNATGSVDYRFTAPEGIPGVVYPITFTTEPGSCARGTITGYLTIVGSPLEWSEIFAPSQFDRLGDSMRRRFSVYTGAEWEASNVTVKFFDPYKSVNVTLPLDTVQGSNAHGWYTFTATDSLRHFIPILAEKPGALPIYDTLEYSVRKR